MIVCTFVHFAYMYNLFLDLRLITDLTSIKLQTVCKFIAIIMRLIVVCSMDRRSMDRLFISNS